MNERVPLSFLLVQHKDEQPPVEPIVPFAAMYGEEPKVVTAVLERTCILASVVDQYDRITVRHDQVAVDPRAIEWRTKTAGYSGESIRPADQKKPGARFRRHMNGLGDARALSDARAIQNQKDVERQKERELAAARQATPVLVSITGGLAASPADGPERIAKPPKETPMPEVLKHCPSCKKDKPKSEFPPGKGFFYCNDCRAERAANGSQNVKVDKAPSERLATPSRRGQIVDGHVVQPAEGMKFCPHCETEKPLEAFGLNKAKADGHQSVCKDCRSTIWTAGSTAMGHARKAAAGDLGAQLKVLIAGLRKKITDLTEENVRLKAELEGVNGQLEDLLAT